MMKKFSFALMTIMIAAMEVVMSQPTLPSNPPQAPIDGGLGLLAAAGGAYAYKKLKDRKNQEENLEE
tara:strand:- start:183 stop:383 length:201 start_codon:yes stop_codon:yes gene_type:complete